MANRRKVKLKGKEVVAKKSLEELKEFSTLARTKALELLTTAFSLVAALAWNSAVQHFFDVKYPNGSGDNIWPKFYYAVSVTFFVVLIIFILTKILGKKDKT